MNEGYLVTLQGPNGKDIIFRLYPKEVKKNGKARVRGGVRQRQKALGPVQTTFNRCCGYVHLCYAKMLRTIGS